MYEEWIGEDLRNDAVPTAYALSGTWPYVELAADAPIGAHYGRRLAQTLKELMDGRGIGQRALAEQSGVAHSTVGRVLRGEVYCDLATLARLEQALETSLYPDGLYRMIRRSPDPG